MTAVISSRENSPSERKLIDVILETGQDKSIIYGDILVYITASSSNSAGKTSTVRQFAEPWKMNYVSGLSRVMTILG